MARAIRGMLTGGLAMDPMCDSAGQIYGALSSWPPFTRTVRGLGALAIVIALLVLLGWQTGISILLTFIPSGVPMNPLTALVIMALGAGIGMTSGLPRTRHLVSAVQVLGAAVTLVSLIRLADYVIKLPWHPDATLYAAELQKVAFAPNRMAPETALASLFGGMALFLLPLCAARARLMAQFAGIGLLSTAVFGLSCYVLTVGWFAHRGAHIPMALNTAVGYLAISIAVLLLTDGVGIMRPLHSTWPGGILLRRFLPAIILVPMALGWLRGWLEFHLHLLGARTAGGLFVTLLMLILAAASYAVARRMDRIAKARQESLENARSAQRQAALARRQAEEATQAKSQFLASMSHEIRTPLHGVLSMLSLLEETSLNRQQRHYAQIARTSASTLLGVIDDVLDFSKIEAGKLELHLNDFDLRVSTEDTLYMLLPNARRKGLELSYQFAPHFSGLVIGDMLRLRQVLVNLLHNAIKFTDSGSVQLKVIPAPPPGDDAHAMARDARIVPVHFAVHDTGIGIPSDQCARLFTEFAQVPPRHGKFHSGTGLGLAISRRLVELMGGSICVQSTPGQGSCFSFTVPLRERKGPWLDADSIPTALRKLTVLLAVPSATVRQHLLEQLSFWQLQVQTVEPQTELSAELRRRAAAGSPVDIVILDYDKSPADFSGLLEQINADPRIRRPGILFLSDADAGFDEDVMARHGLCVKLARPLRQSQLFDGLMQLLTRSLSPAAAAPTRPVRRLRADESLCGLTVVVAEDNEINQYVITSVLEQMGFECRVASNGRDCIALLESQPAAMVLLDCLMPVMDGFQTVKEIRRRELAGRLFSSQGRGRIPVIALTANTVGNDRQACLDAGMDDFLAKPLDRQLLLTKMRRFLMAEPTSSDGSQMPAATAVAKGDESAEGSPPLDIPRLLTFCDQDQGVVDQLLSRFSRQTSSHLADLAMAIRNLDWDAATRHAHSIKGTAASLFAPRLHTRAAHMERQCRDLRNPVAAAEGLKTLEQAIMECTEFIQTGLSRR